MTARQLVHTYISKDAAFEVSVNLIIVPVTVEHLLAHARALHVSRRLRLMTVKAEDARERHAAFRIFYIFAVPGESQLLGLRLDVPEGQAAPSLVETMHEASLYEREIHSFFGIEFTGHPDTRPFILQENWPADVRPLRKDVAWNKRPKEAHEEYTFHQLQGEGVYEIPVGPIHAGVIEPGHFRFSVVGEEIVRLEPQLGFVHKGIEKLFEQLPLQRQRELAENVSGDTAFSHSLAFCQAVETLAGVKVPMRAKYLRVIFSELERLANHVNDVGFILNDTGFTFGGSNGTRLREQIVQICERLGGHRFLRGVSCIGGVAKDISPSAALALQEELVHFAKDFQEFVDITADSETVANRLHTTGILQRQIAYDHGVVGVAAKAAGLARDVRVEHPYAAYDELPLKIVRETDGDVYARYQVRVREVAASLDVIRRALDVLPRGPIAADGDVQLPSHAYAVGMTEGWRGDIVYFIGTDADGAIARVGVRDPSFLNWPAVPFAVASNIVPDFPLINKSFNLSYSGFDR